MKVFIFNIEHYLPFEQESQNYLVRLPVIHCGLDVQVHDHVHQRTMRGAGREAAEEEAVRAVRDFAPDVVLYFQCWKDEDLSPRAFERIRALGIPVIGFLWDSNVNPRWNEIRLFDNVDYLVIVDSINAYVRWKTLARFSFPEKHVLFGGGLYYVDPAEPTEFEKTQDVMLVGSVEGARADLLSFLKDELDKRSIKFSKAGGLVNDERTVTDSERRWLTPLEYNQAIRQSRICLSSQSVSNRAHIKGKIFEIMARGTLCLADDSSENRKFFPAGVMPTYHSNEDCVRQIEYFLSHPNERKVIEDNASRWLREHFDYKVFYQSLLTHAVNRSGALPSLPVLDREFKAAWSQRGLLLPVLADSVTDLVRHVDRTADMAELRAAVAQPVKGPPLLSIHMQSNRPDNFRVFLDAMEESADDPSRVEVVVKIDDTDEAMNAMLAEEVKKRRLRLKYISTPLPEGFYGLWRSMNDMLKVCDPNVYFVLNLNDEMRFVGQGWDTRLARYVGLFEDGIYRLRTSDKRHRNYFDFWEAGFANDTSAIMTRRWIEIGGNWCPCNGPDSFQQCVAFYYGWNRRFDQLQEAREIPIEDIQFEFKGSNLGLSNEALMRRIRGAIVPWFLLMSHTMQEEASRRAEKLRANMAAHRLALANFTIRDDLKTRTIELIDPANGDIAASFPYGLSRWRIGATNWLRMFNYGYYGGGGSRVGKNVCRNYGHYLWHRRPSLMGKLARIRSLLNPRTWFGPLWQAYVEAHEPPVPGHSALFYAVRWVMLIGIVKPKRFLGLRRP